jgi:hypothetical protein
MVRSGKPESASDQPSLGDLVALAAKDISSLIRYEIALAKSELKIDGIRLATAGGLVALGVIVVFPGIILLCFAYAYFLHWAGAWGGLAGAFGFAGLTFVVLALVAVVVARVFVKKVTGMRMTRKTVSDDLGMLRRGEDGEGSPDGHGPAVPNPRSTAVGPEAKAEIPARQLRALTGGMPTCKQNQPSRSTGRGRTVRSARTGLGSTLRATGTDRSSCCCTGFPSSGGRGAGSSSRCRRPGTGPSRPTCAATAAATSRPGAMT